MNTNNLITISFFKNLGKLFYAIAYADKKMEEEEFNAIKENIHNVYSSLSFKDTLSEANAEHHIISTFNALHTKNRKSEDCFNDFINFKRNNESLFTNSVKRIILKTAGRIASSFSGKNKSELIMLAKLSIEFKKIKP